MPSYLTGYLFLSYHVGCFWAICLGIHLSFDRDWPFRSVMAIIVFLTVLSPVLAPVETVAMMMLGVWKLVQGAIDIPGLARKGQRQSRQDRIEKMEAMLEEARKVAYSSERIER